MGFFDFNCAQMAPGESESDLACTVQFGAETDLFNLRCTWFNKKKPSEMASFLWYNQSRYYGPLIELTSFREKSFFRVTFDTQTIGWLYKNKIAWNWKHLLLGTQVMSEVLYQVFLSHYQIKCLYHRVIFDDTGPCSIKVSNPRPHAFIEKIIINSDRSFITLALVINVCFPLLSITVLFHEKLGRETLCPICFSVWDFYVLQQNGWTTWYTAQKQYLTCVRWRRMNKCT